MWKEEEKFKIQNATNWKQRSGMSFVTGLTCNVVGMAFQATHRNGQGWGRGQPSPDSTFTP